MKLLFHPLLLSPQRVNVVTLAEPKVQFPQRLLPFPNKKKKKSSLLLHISALRSEIINSIWWEGRKRGRKRTFAQVLDSSSLAVCTKFRLFSWNKAKETAYIVENQTSAGPRTCPSVPIASGPSLPLLGLSVHLTTPTHSPPSHKLISSLHLKFRILTDLPLLFIQLSCVPART